MEWIKSGTHAQSTVLIEVGKLLPGTCSVAGHIVEFGKDVTLLTQLLIGLDGSEEMGVLGVDGAAATVEQRR